MGRLSIYTKRENLERSLRNQLYRWEGLDSAMGSGNI